MKKTTAAEWLKMESRALSCRHMFENQWQLVGEFVNQTKIDFTTELTPGSFIHQHLWDDSGIHLSNTSASALIGYVWGAGVKSFRLLGNEEVFGDAPEMKEFWEMATKALGREMKDSEAGLNTAMDESFLELVNNGTDFIYLEERNIDKPSHGCLAFTPWSVQNVSLRDNSYRKATKFFRRKKYKIDDLVGKYGIKNVSKKSQRLYEQKKFDEEVNVLLVIFDRPESQRVEGSIAAKDMPIGSVHIEVDSKKILRESGFQEPRVACTRLSRRVTEDYGRGFGMNALPSIMMLNQVKEDYMLAMEKQLDPPMYQINDAVSGNGYIDTSAGAINILRVDTSNGANPTGKLFDIQEVRSAPEVIQMLQENISQHYLIDRLLDLNNGVEMTKGEAFLRNSLRQGSLRSVTSRLLSEKFDVLIDSAFQICLRRNKFGYMPGDPEAEAREARNLPVKYLPQRLVDAIEADEDLYDIEYLTPAARDMLADEGQGMVEMVQIGSQMAQYDEDVKREFNNSWILRRLGEIKGTSTDMWNPKEEVAAEKAQEQKQIAAQQEAAMLQQQAGAAKDAAEAQAKSQ